MLFQLGKSFTRTPITLQRLDDLGTYLMSQCPEGCIAIEFRHPSWFDEDGWVGGWIGRQELLSTVRGCLNLVSPILFKPRARRREAYLILQRHGLCLCDIHVANPPNNDNEEGEEDDTWGSLQTGCHPPLSAYPHTGCDWGVYLRFHGDHSRGSYGAQSLETWADAVWRWRRDGLPPNGPASQQRRVLAFFNNDASMDDQGEHGLPSAVADAHRLGQLLARRLEAQAEDAGEGSGVGIVIKREQPS